MKNSETAKYFENSGSVRGIEKERDNKSERDRERKRGTVIKRYI